LGDSTQFELVISLRSLGKRYVLFVYSTPTRVTPYLAKFRTNTVAPEFSVVADEDLFRIDPANVTGYSCQPLPSFLSLLSLGPYCLQVVAVRLLKSRVAMRVGRTGLGLYPLL
jgi:hypothetical protein